MVHLITFALKIIITSPDQIEKMHVIIQGVRARGIQKYMLMV